MALTQDYSAITVSKPHTGDALLRGVNLTGWSADIDAISQGGKIFWKVTTGDVLELYSDDARSNRVAYGSISSGAVTLAQDNASGLSGSAVVDYTSGDESTGVLVVSYADESDMSAVMHSFAGYTDDAENIGDWDGGGTRLERAFNIAKVELDGMIAAKAGNGAPTKSDGTRDYTAVVLTQNFRMVHAHLTAAVMERRQMSIDPSEDREAMVSMHERRAKTLWQGTEVTINTKSDNKANGVVVSQSVGRG